MAPQVLSAGVEGGFPACGAPRIVAPCIWMIMIRSPTARFPGNLGGLAFRELAATVIVVAPAGASAVSAVYSLTILFAVATTFAPCLLRWAKTSPPAPLLKRG